MAWSLERILDLEREASVVVLTTGATLSVAMAADESAEAASLRRATVVLDRSRDHT